MIAGSYNSVTEVSYCSVTKVRTKTSPLVYIKKQPMFPLIVSPELANWLPLFAFAGNTNRLSLSLKTALIRKVQLHPLCRK